MNLLEIYIVEVIKVTEEERHVSVEFIGQCYGAVNRYYWGFADMDTWEKVLERGYVQG